MEPRSANYKKLSAAISGGLVAGASAVFLNFGPCEFLQWDDKIHLQDNPLITNVRFHSLFELWRYPFAHLYTPLPYTLWAFFSLVLHHMGFSNWASDQLTLPFQLLNLATHLLNGYLFYLLTGRIFPKSPAFARLLGVFIFLFHPIQVESVSWVSGFRELIWTTFALASLCAYWDGRTPASFVFYIAALLCKPTAIVLPFLNITLDFMRTERRPVNWKLFSFMAGAGAVMAVGVTGLQPSRIVESAPSVLYRGLVALDSLGFYLTKAIAPIHLAPDYGRHPDWLAAQGFTFQMGFGLAALGLVAWLLRRSARSRSRDKDAALASAFFILPIAPVLGLVPFAFQNYSTVADRYLYFSMTGLALLVVSRFSMEMPKWSRLFLPLLLVLPVLSFRQSRYWRNNEAYISHELAVNPNSFAAESSAGVIAWQAGHADEAKSHFERARQLNPNFLDPIQDLGVLAMSRKDYAQAEKYFSELVERFPDAANGPVALGVLKVKEGQYEQAIPLLNRATQSERENFLAQSYLGYANLKLNHYRDALEHLTAAAELNPLDQSVQSNLTAVRAQLAGRLTPGQQ